MNKPNKFIPKLSFGKIAFIVTILLSCYSCKDLQKAKDGSSSEDFVGSWVTDERSVASVAEIFKQYGYGDKINTTTTFVFQRDSSLKIIDEITSGNNFKENFEMGGTYRVIKANENGFPSLIIMTKIDSATIKKSIDVLIRLMEKNNDIGVVFIKPMIPMLMKQYSNYKENTSFTYKVMSLSDKELILNDANEKTLLFKPVTSISTEDSSKTQSKK